MEKAVTSSLCIWRNHADVRYSRLQEPAVAAMTEMLASGSPRATAAVVCLVREVFCRTAGQPGPIFAANRLAVANSSIATTLAAMMAPAAVEWGGLMTPAILAETVAVLVAGRPSYRYPARDTRPCPVVSRPIDQYGHWT